MAWNVLAVVQSMQVIDLLRSGALIVGFLAVIIGYRNHSDSAAKWIKIDTITTAFFGLAFFVAPDMVLGYMVNGKLDPVHLLLARTYGAFLLGASCTSSYFYLRSSNKSQRVLCSTIVLALLFLTMFMGHAKSQKDGGQKFNDQHLTFSMLAVFLGLVGCVFQLVKVNELGQVASRGFSLRSHADLHTFIDMMICFVCCFMYYAYPSFIFSFFEVKNFKMDLVHAQLCRVLAVVVFNQALGFLQALFSGSAEDRHAQVVGRLATLMVALPTMYCYQWWYELMSVQVFTVGLVFCHVPLVLNLAAAYYAGRQK